MFAKANRMEFLYHQIGGDVITLSEDISAFAEISAPLSDLLKKGKSEQVQLNEAQELAYSLLKEYLLQEPVLKLPDLIKPFRSENRRIRSWSTRCTFAGERRKERNQ